MRLPTHTLVQLTATCLLRCGPPLMGENPSMDWPEVQAELDKVPVFTLVNAGQEPCGLPVPRFFIDPADAEAALARDLSAARGLRGAGAALAADVLSGVRVQPVGLGSAFNLVRQEKALFVPQAADLSATEGMEGGEQIEGGMPYRLVHKDVAKAWPDFVDLVQEAANAPGGIMKPSNFAQIMQNTHMHAQRQHGEFGTIQWETVESQILRSKPQYPTDVPHIVKYVQMWSGGLKDPVFLDDLTAFFATLVQIRVVRGGRSSS